MSTILKSHKVAVTGAAGFIGLHLLRGLHAAGADIVAIVADEKAASHLDALPFSVERIVIPDVLKLGDVIKRAEPRFVVHLSAFISTDRTLHSLEKTLQWNLLSTVSLLAACTEIQADRVILMGSCEEYGQNLSPFDPSLAPDPNSPYGASKAAATAYARMFYGSFKLPTVVLRPSVVYGPGQAPRMLIPMVMQALAAHRSIDVTEGRQTRDFVYVSDVVDALLLALTAPGIVGDAWNIGSGEVVTVRECIEQIERITGRTGLVHYGARAYVDREIFHYEPLVEKTYETFNWKPAVMLAEGLLRTWQSIAHPVQATLHPTL